MLPHLVNFLKTVRLDLQLSAEVSQQLSTKTGIPGPLLPFLLLTMDKNKTHLELWLLV